MKVILFGALGAMGRAVSTLAAERENIEIAAGFDTRTIDNSAYPIYTEFAELPSADIAIDFSHHTATRAIAEYCRAQRLPLVCATTGVDGETEEYLREISEYVPIFRSKNFSYGVSVLKRLVRQASELLSDTFDIEIVEAHHNKKADAPSGTAQLLLEEVRAGMKEAGRDVYGRYGTSAKREKNDVGISAIRGGTIVGTHSVIFAGSDEVITITHAAQSKAVFAGGALIAAQYLCGRQSGYYTMDDIAAETNI